MTDKKKILLVSMGNLHFFRWCEVLDTEKYEFHWFDILDGGSKSKRIPNIIQKIGWKYKINYPLRYTIKVKLPSFYNFLARFNDRSAETIFAKYVEQIKPDLIHSFEVDISCKPILNFMTKNKIPWMLSTWGSDIYFAKFNADTEQRLRQTLRRVNFLITDCLRDYEICKQLGYGAVFSGIIPGGTGINLQFIQEQKIDWNKRRIIIIKGYQGKYGRCIEVLKALKNIGWILEKFKVYVFSANLEVAEFIKNELHELDVEYNFGMQHDELIKQMCKSCIYIGNSISDGIPNTLIEAIASGCIPIQSNPGNASAELIIHKFNGMLISEPENINHIEEILKNTINNYVQFENGLKYNSELANKFDRAKIKVEIQNLYRNLLNGHS